MNLHEHRPLANQILEELVNRGKRHRDWPDAQAEARIEDELRARGKNFLDAWERVIAKTREGTGGRIYSDLDGARTEGLALMYFPTDRRPDDFDERRFVAPTSMRDVEPNTHIWLRYSQLDERY
jgi:hypothetical protein